MRKYILTYNKDKSEFSSEEIRTGVIRFLYKNGATEIKQHLDTTFVFESYKMTNQWMRLVVDELCDENNVFNNVLYIFTRVFYHSETKNEMFESCNSKLQDFVDETIVNMKRVENLRIVKR